MSDPGTNAQLATVLADLGKKVDALGKHLDELEGAISKKNARDGWDIFQLLMAALTPVIFFAVTQTIETPLKESAASLQQAQFALAQTTAIQNKLLAEAKEQDDEKKTRATIADTLYKFMDPLTGTDLPKQKFAAKVVTLVLAEKAAAFLQALSDLQPAGTGSQDTAVSALAKAGDIRRDAIIADFFSASAAVRKDAYQRLLDYRTDPKVIEPLLNAAAANPSNLDATVNALNFLRVMQPLTLTPALNARVMAFADSVRANGSITSSAADALKTAIRNGQSTVYLQFGGQIARPLMEALRAQLNNAGYVAPGTEHFDRPFATEVKYYNPADAGPAAAVAALAIPILPRRARVRRG